MVSHYPTPNNIQDQDIRRVLQQTTTISRYKVLPTNPHHNHLKLQAPSSITVGLECAAVVLHQTPNFANSPAPPPPSFGEEGPIMKKMKALVAFKSKVIKPCTRMLSVFIIRINKRSSFSLKGPRFRAPTLRRPRLGRRRRHTIRTQVVRFRKPFSIKSIRLPKSRPKPKLRLRKPPTLLTRKSLRFRRRRRSTTTTVASASTKKKRTKTTTPRTPATDTTPGATDTTGERVGQRIAELLSLFKSMRSSPKDLEDHQVMDITSISDVGTNGKEPFPSPITPAFVRRSVGSKKDSSDDLEDVEDACRSFENYLVEMIIEEGKLKDLMDVEELLYCWRNLTSPIFIDLVCRFYGELCKDLFSLDDDDEEEEITTPSGPPPSE